jgi:hypothetical protein
VNYDPNETSMQVTLPCGLQVTFEMDMEYPQPHASVLISKIDAPVDFKCQQLQNIMVNITLVKFPDVLSSSNISTRVSRHPYYILLMSLRRTPKSETTSFFL